MKKNKRRWRPSAKHQSVNKVNTPASSKVVPLRSLTPELCVKLRRDLTKACLEVAETYGLTVEGGELSDIDLRNGFGIGFRVGIPMEDGTLYSPDKALFEVLAPQFGLEASDYGRTFSRHGERYRIVGINPNRPKYPISAERVADGRGFKFPAENVALYLHDT